MTEDFNYFQRKFLNWQKNGKTLKNIIHHDVSIFQENNYL
jgi:hypothetical protein